ncbi:MAG: chromosome segregation protein SMC [Candidatus Geothermincolia bacterium]
MYLKSIGLKGFKSFADKTAIGFEPGISVIVGPNGSGKSNVADAVLWVLGEQSPKSLRGGRMEDVIFAGSASRQPLGMAEVSLSVDNSKRDLPLDFEEVVITRQLLRSGESQYLLNGAACRLLDIQELLSDLGVGKEMTAVIGQGKLDMVIASRPEERRAFLEEAAGLLKHRRRKEKALRKLEAADQNLLRINDIVSEVRRQIKPLERQAKVAEEYRQLEARLRELGIRLVVKELEVLQEGSSRQREEEARSRQRLEASRAFLSEGRNRMLELESALAQMSHGCELSRQEEYRAASIRDKLTSQLELSRERAHLVDALATRAAGADPATAKRKLEELEGSLAEAAREMSEAQERWRSLHDERRELNAALRQSRTSVKEREGREQEMLRSLAGANQRRTAMTERLERLQARQADLTERLARIEPALREAAHEMEAAATKALMLREREEQLRSRMEQSYEALERGRAELRQVQERRLTTERNEGRMEERLKALKEMILARGEYMQAAQRLTSGNGTGNRGILIDLLQIDPAWERALEAYLGRWLAAAVVDDVKTALRCMRQLKRDDAGVAVFLPLKEAARFSVGAHPALAPHDIVATGVVRCAPQLQPLVDFLLENVILVESLDEAEAKAERYPDCAVVTREGDILAPRRLIEGGGRRDGASSLVARQREMDELERELGELGRGHEKLKAEAGSIESFLDNLEQGVASQKRELDGLLPHLRAAEEQRAVLRLTLAGLQQEQAQLSDAYRENEAETVSLDREIKQQETTLESLASARAELAAVREISSEALREAEDAWSAFQEREDVLKLSLAGQQERRHHLEARATELRQQEAAMLRLLDASGGYGTQAAALRRLAATLEELLLAAGSEVEARQTARTEEEKRLVAMEEETVGLRRKLAEEEERQGELTDTLHRLELAATELKLKVEAQVARLLEDYQVSLEAAFNTYLGSEPVEELRAELRAAEQRKQVLGPVNLLAEREYAALTERYDFLEEQVADLKDSKAALARVVRAVDSEIARIFAETFDEVNRHFQELFAMLFPNGRAELTLTDPDDLLRAGVEIEAQPSGKRVRKLSLLSGGEMALTSLAFLFAIFKARPSPFYFLDEVEAALDDANLHRFLQMIKQFRGDSQLVIISHQKRTMEIADILYGISMQAGGVSRALSLRMDDERRLVAAPA